MAAWARRRRMKRAVRMPDNLFIMGKINECWKKKEVGVDERSRESSKMLQKCLES